MFCPSCGKQNIEIVRWDTCQDCGCVFKILNTRIQKERGW